MVVDLSYIVFLDIHGGNVNGRNGHPLFWKLWGEFLINLKKREMMHLSLIPLLEHQQPQSFEFGSHLDILLIQFLGVFAKQFSQ